MAFMGIKADEWLTCTSSQNQDADGAQIAALASRLILSYRAQRPPLKVYQSMGGSRR